MLAVPVLRPFILLLLLLYPGDGLGEVPGALLGCGGGPAGGEDGQGGEEDWGDNGDGNDKYKSNMDDDDADDENLDDLRSSPFLGMSVLRRRMAWSSQTHACIFL